MRTLTSALVVLGLAAGSGFAQIDVNIAPVVAPLGGNIVVCVTNDTAQTQLVGSIGPIRVLDQANNEIFSYLALLFVPMPLNPGTVNTYLLWDQFDNSGQAVPPGVYTMEVDVNGTITNHLFVIDGSFGSGIGPYGVQRPNTARSLFITAPQDGGKTYVCAASFGFNPGIPTCGGTVPLNPDFLLTLSTTPNNGVFFNTVGTLDPGGTTQLPVVALPNAPQLSGLTYYVACLVLDPLVACPLTSISAPAQITIL